MNGIDGINGIDGQDHDMPDTQQQAEQSTTAPPPGAQPERQPNKERVTTPYLTKYERARILGTRALQIR
jgi:DNA-directed RNA polymerase I, II, and III subunit RPABC2